MDGAAGVADGAGGTGVLVWNTMLSKGNKQWFPVNLRNSLGYYNQSEGGELPQVTVQHPSLIQGPDISGVPTQRNWGKLRMRLGPETGDPLSLSVEGILRAQRADRADHSFLQALTQFRRCMAVRWRRTGLLSVGTGRSPTMAAIISP